MGDVNNQDDWTIPPSPPRNLAWVESLVYLTSPLSVAGSAYAASVAYESVTYHGAENYGVMVLMLVGISLLGIQAGMLSPLAWVCASSIKTRSPKRQVGWMYGLAIIPPV